MGIAGVESEWCKILNVETNEGTTYAALQSDPGVNEVTEDEETPDPEARNGVQLTRRKGPQMAKGAKC